MQTSKLFARFIGPIFVAIGLAQIINADVLRTLVGQFLDSYALIFLAGIMAMLAGLAIVNFHNLWVSDWRVVVTIFGWLALIGGVIRIVLPQQTAQIGTAIFNVPNITIISGLFTLALGAWLSVMGYRNANGKPASARKQVRRK
jgi:hypothetical protein